MSRRSRGEGRYYTRISPPALLGEYRRSRGVGRCSRRRRLAGLATPYPQAGPFPHRFALGDRSGSARKRVPSPIASLWGTDPVSTGGAGEGVGAPDVGLARVWRPPTRKRVPSPIASLWGTDPVSTGGAGEGVGAPDVGVSGVLGRVW